MTAGTPFVSDSDFTLYVGDVRQVLATLADGTVDCCVTSPPYWGLRDYGTGQWEGGDPDCDHLGAPFRTKSKINENCGTGVDRKNAEGREPMGQQCSKCGASRKDSQIGLEQTPELFVAELVAVFREVRRVLADHGTCWLNLGDSYVGAPVGSFNGGGFKDKSAATGGRDLSGVATSGTLDKTKATGLKPKDLVGIPWRVAFALQADGWYLRSDIIWAKPNPMPESVTDRPTKSHEYVFLLSKQPRYFFDQEAVREPHSPDGRTVTQVVGQNGSIQHRDGERWPNGGRNIRTVWDIATQPYAEAHFATFPEELARRCIVAGCPEWVCRTCGKPRERIVERQNESAYARIKREYSITYQDMKAEAAANGITPGNVGGTHAPGQRGAQLDPTQNKTVGWSDCGHDNYRPGVVLDPFMGSGTTALVARKHGRHAIGVELNQEYAELCSRRNAQQTIFSEDAA